jgi:hypothetical protein
MQLLSDDKIAYRPEVFVDAGGNARMRWRLPGQSDALPDVYMQRGSPTSDAGGWFLYVFDAERTPAFDVRAHCASDLAAPPAGPWTDLSNGFALQLTVTQWRAAVPVPRAAEAYAQVRRAEGGCVPDYRGDVSQCGCRLPDAAAKGASEAGVRAFCSASAACLGYYDVSFMGSAGFVATGTDPASCTARGRQANGSFYAKTRPFGTAAPVASAAAGAPVAHVGTIAGTASGWSVTLRRLTQAAYGHTVQTWSFVGTGPSLAAAAWRLEGAAAPWLRVAEAPAPSARQALGTCHVTLPAALPPASGYYRWSGAAWTRDVITADGVVLGELLGPADALASGTWRLALQTHGPSAVRLSVLSYTGLLPGAVATRAWTEAHGAASVVTTRFSA